jgi:HD-like signal output (HDOD) protein
MTEEENDALKRVLLIADIAYHWNCIPHAKVIRRLMKMWDLPAPVRAMLLRIARKPMNTAAKAVRYALPLEGEAPYEIEYAEHLVRKDKPC